MSGLIPVYMWEHVGAYITFLCSSKPLHKLFIETHKKALHLRVYFYIDWINNHTFSLLGYIESLPHLNCIRYVKCRLTFRCSTSRVECIYISVTFLFGPFLKLSYSRNGLINFKFAHCAKSWIFPTTIEDM